MNIKIKKKQHNELMRILDKNLTPNKVTFGSHMYGTNNENSDQDVMLFYKVPDRWKAVYNIYPNIHQFQYDDIDNNIQYIWTSHQQFIQNLISGDSTINADIILFSDLMKREFAFDEPIRLNMCKTYKVMKAYLGFAKRDLKSTTIKKINHAHRCLKIVEELLNDRIPELNELHVDISDELDSEHKNIIESIRQKLIEKQKYLRVEINELYDSGKLQSYYTGFTDIIENPNSIDKLLSKLVISNNTKEFKY